jgi:DNA mismatch repair protein MutS
MLRPDGVFFHSILFETAADRAGDDSLEAPAFFADLNCDQIVAAITSGREAYDLKPFFHARLHRAAAITFRQEVMQDLEDASLHERVTSFAAGMQHVRDHLLRSEKSHYQEQRQAWFLDAIRVYCQAVSAFADGLAPLDPTSAGFRGFRAYLMRYAGSAHFNALATEARDIKATLDAVDYCVHIRGNGFTVRRSQGETDYSAEVEATFNKFKQGAVRDYLVKFSDSEAMNHVEAKILEFVAKLNSEAFGALSHFCQRRSDFMDRSLVAFDREVQFYIAYMEYIAGLKRAGLYFCYPRICEKSGEVSSRDGFDIALAHKLVGDRAPVVCNDFDLSRDERVLVISGPNQGGKTTFARAFGQLHYLASLGLPVPGREAQLLLCDEIFTHFEKEEKVKNLRGKLEDDLMRIRDVVLQATAQSIIVMNEVFTSTTIQDETFLSKKVLEEIIARGSLCVWVTFVDELASFAPQTVSMVSVIAPDNPTQRTFKIVRKPADGLAYAMAIAQKYRLTYSAITERICS